HTVAWAPVPWAESAEEGGPPGKLVLGGAQPHFVLEGLGPLNYAQLDLAGRVETGDAPDAGPYQVEVRLQPGDLREYHDPATLPAPREPDRHPIQARPGFDQRPERLGPPPRRGAIQRYRSRQPLAAGRRCAGQRSLSYAAPVHPPAADRA